MSIYNIQATSIDGQENYLSNFSGKVTLIVNVSTKAGGYTPRCSKVWSYARTCRQLWQLQQVHDEFKDRGFSVLAFPNNQFANMEPGTNEEIFEFVKKHYSFVTFPFFEKVDVNGKNEHLLFSRLKGNEKRNYSDFTANQSQEAQDNQNLAGQAIARISHGYEKFLVSRDGVMVARFNWQDMPLDEIPRIMGAGWTIREAIDEVLG
jgi:glutathione peroxidase